MQEKLRKIKWEKLIIPAIIFLIVVIAFEIGMLINSKSTKSQILSEKYRNDRLEAEITSLQNQISQTEDELASLELQNDNYSQRQTQLLGNLNNLRKRVAGLSTQAQSQEKYPFVVPSIGVVGTENGTFGGQMYHMKHLGIDIWSTTANGGRIASHKGNVVRSACTGKVVNIGSSNADVTIKCDPISGDFNVPETQVYTHYAHMGHAETKELYILVQRNQRVEAGDKIGYQGDLSSYFPEMRNVHLHFSVFTGNSETDPNGGAINPCLYIGGNCQKNGEIFTYESSSIAVATEKDERSGYHCFSRSIGRA